MSARDRFGFLENGRYTRVGGTRAGIASSMTQDQAGDLWIVQHNLGLLHSVVPGCLRRRGLALLAGLYRLRVGYLRRQFNMTLEARVQERTRIARELHDTLLQSFHWRALRWIE